MTAHYCSYCGSRQHNINLCPKTAAGASARTHLRCHYCGASGHRQEACPKTWGGNAARTWDAGAIAAHFVTDREP